MELKVYQQKVIADLKRYLELLGEMRDSAAAYHAFWQEKGAAAVKNMGDGTQENVPLAEVPAYIAGRIK